MMNSQRCNEALQHIPAHDRDIWCKMGMALKSEFGDSGFELWEAWSQQADNFNSKDARDVWKSIRPAGKVGIGSLFHEAKAHGWRDDGTHQKPTPEELAERRRVAAERAAQEESEIARERAQAAKKATALWKSATAAKADHPYLVRKQVAPVSTLREIDAGEAASILGYAPKSGDEALTGRLLVVPVKRGDRLATVELIDGDGRKAALYGRGSKVGGFWAAQSLPDSSGDGLTLIIGEGVATVLSAREATGHHVIAALASGNLLAVARSMRERYPDAALVLLADLVKATGEPDQHAVEAAHAVGGKLAIPACGVGRDPNMKDMNDIFILGGVEAVAQAIANAHAPGDAERQASDENAPAVDSETLHDAVIRHPYAGGRFECSRKGVFHVGPDKEGGELPPKWICSPLVAKAKTRDAKGSEWGRLLEWRDDDRVLHQWAMPLELLQGDGREVRQELSRMGLTIAPDRAARDLLATYLQVCAVAHRARCVDRLGWHGSVYVTPAETIGQDDEIAVFQNAHAIEPAFSVAGTPEDWRDSVAALSAGNSRLVFGLSVAFAGALADVAGEDSGGFHFRGGSSSGKTTALKVAASVWGNPSTYPRLWRATANGLEGLAAMHNDGLLILDELSQIDPKEAGEAAYLLANGQGKARAGRTGGARQSARWRLLFLSAGEESLTALMARAGRRANAGQEIRLADIESDAGAGMGAFEALNGQPNPAALAMAVKDAATKYHGAVGLAWLRCIVADRPNLTEILSDGIRQFVDEVAPKDAAGQVLRVARRFGLVAVAGELATHYGLTGWQEGEAISAAKKCFAAWLESFGGTGNREERAMLSQVRAFFETHGASRFEDVAADHEQRIINRAGFFRTGSDGEKQLMVLPEAFKRDVCQGFDLKAITRVLIDAGWIEPGGDGRPTQKPRLCGKPPTRLYIFTGRMWEGDE